MSRLKFSDIGLSADTMISRMKEVAGMETDAELRAFLARGAKRYGLNKSYTSATISMWRQRDAIPLVDLKIFADECILRGIKIGLTEVIK